MKQEVHPGDRHRLFRSVASHRDVTTVLYPGSYVDLSPAFVFPSVTFVDTDRRARQFFADRAGIDELIAEHDTPATPHVVRFLPADHRQPLDVSDANVDLLVSLFAGLVSEPPCGASRDVRTRCSDRVVSPG